MSINIPPYPALEKILPVILDNIDYVVLICDKNGHFIFVNEAALRHSGTTAEDWLGKTPQDMENRGFFKAFKLDDLRSGKIMTRFFSTKDGQRIISTVKPIFDDTGELIYVLTIAIRPGYINELVSKLEESLSSVMNQESKYRQEIDLLRRNNIHESTPVFASPQMQFLYSNIQRIAPVDCTVLITGESGAGKEVVAKTIHDQSLRKSGPFIPVCIPAIPPNLLESELFGYDEGAFTGSKRKGKPGMVEMADGGTLFLDEIGDIPLNLQVKLLRVLDSGEVTRLGSVRPIKVNFRVVAATNRDIFQMAEKGEFREDLLYRINVINIKIKPLRERIEDIIPLTEHFLAKVNRKYAYRKTISASGKDVLKAYDWPGNVRELRNAVERICILSSGDIITADDIVNLLGIERKPQPPKPTQHSAVKTIQEEYDSFEREQIMNALIRANGNKTKAAELLGMTRTKLYRRLQQLKL